MTSEKKITSEWLKSRPASQNILSLIDPKYWSTEQVSLGITAQSYSRVHIHNRVYDCDIGSGNPSGVATINGSFVEWFKSYVIGVQTRLIQSVSISSVFLPVQTVSTGIYIYK